MTQALLLGVNLHQSTISHRPPLDSTFYILGVLEIMFDTCLVCLLAPKRRLMCM